MFGYMPVVGITGIIKFFIVIMFIPFLYYKRWVNVNEDDFGAHELATIGVQSSFALFMLSWILVYSNLHA